MVWGRAYLIVCNFVKLTFSWYFSQFKLTVNGECVNQSNAEYIRR